MMLKQNITTDKKKYFKVVWLTSHEKITFVEKGVEGLLDFIDNEGLPRLKPSKKKFCRLHVGVVESLKSCFLFGDVSQVSNQL